MAYVTGFTESKQRIRPHETEVDCEYLALNSTRGPLLHLSTFGSKDRVSDRKSSQSLQLDEARARQLVAIINSVFPPAGDD